MSDEGKDLISGVQSIICSIIFISGRLAEESEEETYRKNVRNLKNMMKLRGKIERLSNPLRQGMINTFEK